MAVDHNNPQSRTEEILIATIDGNEYNKLPQSRLEELLLELKDVIEEGGGGGGSVHFVVVEELPITDIDQTAIYLVPKSTTIINNVYDEYINTDGTTSGWELIGTTDIDLSDYITDDDLATVLEDYATTQDLSGKQDTLTAGKYIDIDANDKISVNPVVPNEAFTYVIQQIADYTITVKKIVNNVTVFEETYTNVNQTFDDAITIYAHQQSGMMYYELVVASDTHDAGFKQSMPWYGRNTYTEIFSTVDHTGEKLVIKSELDTAIGAIKDGQSIDSFADVETALANKQDALTAGKYISIDANDEIKVEREIPDEAFAYIIQQTGDGIVKITKTVNSAVVFEETYSGDADVTLDALHYVYNAGVQSYTLLIASDTHDAGFKQVMSWWARDTYTENFSTVDHSGEKLIIKSEMDTALASKQDATDNNLQTTDKTVVGAVNELKSGLTNVQDDVKLNTQDLTTTSRTKNIAPMTLDNLKYYNAAGTWTNNVYVYEGITYTVNTDSNGNISSIGVDGTATGTYSHLTVHGNIKAGSYKLNGAPTGDNYFLQLYKSPTVDIKCKGSDTDVVLASDVENLRYRIVVMGGATADNLTYYPMLRLATETNATYTPYIPSVETRLDNMKYALIKDTTEVTNNTDVSMPDLSQYNTICIEFVARTTATTYRRTTLIIPVVSINQDSIYHMDMTVISGGTDYMSFMMFKFLANGNINVIEVGTTGWTTSNYYVKVYGAK